MAKRKPSLSPMSINNQFSDLSVSGQGGYVAFPSSLAKEIDRMTRDANSPARDTLNKLAALKPGEAPFGIPLTNGLYYIRPTSSGGPKAVGFLYLPPDSKKDMPPTIVTTLTFAQFTELAQTKNKKLTTGIKERVEELRALYPNRAPGTAPAKPKVPEGHKIFTSSLGITG